MDTGILIQNSPEIFLFHGTIDRAADWNVIWSSWPFETQILVWVLSEVTGYSDKCELTAIDFIEELYLNRGIR
jgi:hypothetical protein